MNAPVRHSRFKQVDVSRALSGAIAAGLKPTGYKIEVDGAIVVMFGDAPALPRVNPLDRLLQP